MRLVCGELRSYKDFIITKANIASKPLVGFLDRKIIVLIQIEVHSSKATVPKLQCQSHNAVTALHENSQLNSQLRKLWSVIIIWIRRQS